MSKTIELDETKLPVGMVVGRYKTRIAELETALRGLFCCECGRKFDQADEWEACATHQRIRNLLIEGFFLADTQPPQQKKE